jgi:AraC-like DNA-binding protein
MDYEKLAKEWERNSLLHFLGVVEHVRFVVKDREHRYVYVNRVWQESFAYSDDDLKQLLGKTAMDLFPQWRAERYMQEEAEVMGQEKVFDYEEYLLNADGVLERWRTIKAPWVVNGEVIGFINLGTRMGLVLEQRKDELPSIVHAVLNHACGSETIEEIAQKMGFSRRTMERRFREIMNESPNQFRVRCRLAKAKQLLARGDKVIDVSEACGFNDQSHFSRVFRKHTGTSPKKYQQGAAELN